MQKTWHYFGKISSLLIIVRFLLKNQKNAPAILQFLKALKSRKIVIIAQKEFYS